MVLTKDVPAPINPDPEPLVAPDDPDPGQAEDTEETPDPEEPE